jgi:hypothetical protein
VQCLEYIVVYELVHLLERHHNDRFIAWITFFGSQGSKINLNKPKSRILTRALTVPERAVSIQACPKALIPESELQGSQIPHLGYPWSTPQ